MEIRPIFSALLQSKTAPLLIAIQVALSLAILVNALHVVNLRQQAAARPSGIEDEANVFYMGTRSLQRRSHTETLAQQQIDALALAAIPGVIGVSWVSQMPMSRSGSNSGFSVDRKQVRTSAAVSMYFSPGPLVKTMGLRLVEGRDFTNADIVEFDDDADDSAKKFVSGIIITKALAEVFFPGAASVVGKSVYYGLGERAPETRIIGVVERLQSTEAAVRPDGEYSAIIPYRVSLWGSRFVVRAAPGQRDRAMADAEAVLRKASPVPLFVRARTVDSDRADRYRNERAMVWMLVAVSALLLMITASGIVGMAMLRVAQRQKLIGVRRALGARRRDILRYFIIENFMITSGGVIAGLLLAVGLNQLLVSQLEMSRLPLPYLLYGAVTLWLLGLFSVYAPAWKAASVSPAIATRSA